MTILWRVGDAKSQRLFGFLLSAKQVSAYGTAPWKSPAGTTESLSKHGPEFGEKSGILNGGNIFRIEVVGIASR
jgi:hypothetical protein